jgi:hypothetical protein
MIPGFGLVAMLACAVFFYRLGEQEYSSGIWPAAVSVGLWLGPSYFLGLGMLSNILVQVGLFVVLWLYNVVRDKTTK